MKSFKFTQRFFLLSSVIMFFTFFTITANANSTQGASQLHYNFINAWASGDDGNTVSNAIDNDASTRWSANGDGQWAVFELPAVVEVGYIGIAYHTTSPRTSKFDIEISVDGSNWSPVLTNQESENSISALVQPFILSKPVNAKYIKYIGHGNSKNGWNSLKEFHAYPVSKSGHPVDKLTTPVVNYNPVAFTKSGLYTPDGNKYEIHTPNKVTKSTLSVADFGAIANDNKDDKISIQNAINAAQPGDEIYFPNGTYNLISNNPSDSSDVSATTMLTLKSGVNLRGESKNGVVLLASFVDNSPNKTSIMRILGKNNIMISNMTLKGDVPDPTFTLDSNINTKKTNEPTYIIHIDDSGAGIPSYNIDIKDVVLEKAKTMAIRISKSHNVTVDGITVRNLTDVGGGGAGYGVSIQGAGNKIDRLGYDNDTYFNVVKNSKFEGPYIRHGALIQYYAHNNLVENNTFSNTLLDSIDLHGEDEYLNEIRYNDISNVLKGGAIGVGNTGATHRNAGPFNYIHNNTITNCRDGIRVYLETYDTIIENNSIINSTQPEDAVGIWIQNAPRTIIKGNKITGNTAKGFWGIKVGYDNGDPINGGSGFPEDVTIKDNIVTGNDNGVWIKEGYFITLLNNTISNNINVQLIDNSSMFSEVKNAKVDKKDSELTLTWENPTKAFFNGVKIYKDGQLLTTLDKAVNTYTISNLKNGTIYSYTIKTLDKNNGESAGITLSGSPVGNVATKSFPAVRDTFVEFTKTSDRNAVDFGSGTTTSHKQLKVKNQSTTKRVTFMTFDISEHKGNIGSVMLNLATTFGTITDKSPGESNLTIYGISDTSWTENSLSWNKAIAKGLFSEKTVEGTGDNIVIPKNAVNLGTIRVSSNIKYYNIDVTDYLAGKKIVTFMLLGEYNNGANLSILSRENTKDEDKTTLIISEK